MSTVVCDADRPILSVVRLLESGWSIRLKKTITLCKSDAPNTTREDDATEAYRSCVPHQPQETEDCLRRPDSTNRKGPLET